MWRVALLAPVVGVCLGTTCQPAEPRTTVILHNQTIYPILAELLFQNHVDITEEQLEQTGAVAIFSPSPAWIQTFSLPCQDLQAIMVNDSVMQVGPGINPHASTGVYREGINFDCGDTIEFTFTAANLGTGLEITFSQQQ